VRNRRNRLDSHARDSEPAPRGHRPVNIGLLLQCSVTPSLRSGQGSDRFHLKYSR
jgi:hypothetical protein